MEKDVSWKEYFRDDERYADVINGIGCGGMQLVAAEDMQEDESFQQMEEDTYEVVVKYVKAEELIQVKEEYRKDGKVDMCQA